MAPRTQPARRSQLPPPMFQRAVQTDLPAHLFDGIRTVHYRSDAGFHPDQDRREKWHGPVPADVCPGGGSPPARCAGPPPRFSRAQSAACTASRSPGSTTRPPRRSRKSVIDALSNFYAYDNSNIHRGAHTLAARATDAYEQARAEGADVSGGFIDQGDYFRPRDHGGNQPDCPNVWPQVLAAGRRDRAVHARASCQHRSVANDRPREREPC